MACVSPNDIRDLRDRLGWTGEQMGAFFGRTKVTIYNWENGGSQPAKPVQAIVETLRTELIRRERHQSRKKVSAWIQKLETGGVFGFLEGLVSKPEQQKEIRRDLARKAAERGGLLLQRSRSAPVAYVVPLTETGLIDYARRLLQLPSASEKLLETTS